jgi:hypothetical protein
MNVVEKIKIHVSCPITFFRKSYRLCNIVKKYGGARYTANDSMVARRMMD